MTTTAPAATSTAPPRTTAPKTSSRTQPHRRSAPPPGRGWRTMFGNATLALLIVLTGFGIWRVYDGMDRSATPPVTPESSIPGLAMQPATPEATSQAPVLVPTPEPASACDFSADMPIFPQVDVSPVEGTALLLTTTGDLVLTCPAEPEPITLASGVDQVSPTNWPGIISVSPPFIQGEVPDITYLSVITGQSLGIGTHLSESGRGTSITENSPWFVHPMADASNQWAVTDLRTMETRALSSFIDTPETFPPGTSLIVAASEQAVVIGISTENGIEGEGSLYPVDGLPGTLLVVNNTFDNAHWIDTPVDLAKTRRLALAPAGDYLALKSNDGEASFDGTITYTILRTSDGVEVARSEGIEDFSSEMRWVQDGAALVYTNTNSLMLLAADGSDSPVTLLESPHPLANLYTTYDSDVVMARQQQPEEVATETPELVQPLTYVVNTGTGESMEILGADASINMSPYEQDSRYMVMVDDYVRDGEPHTYRVIDSVTGEQVGEIADVAIPINQGGYPGLGRFSIASTDDGSTEVFGFSPAELWLMTMDGDSTVIRQIASPPGKEDATQGMANVFLSPDGSLLSLTIEGDETRTRWLLPLDTATDEWIEVPSTVPGSGPDTIWFVTGTGYAPVTSPVAPESEATPNTEDAIQSASACDFTADIPILPEVNESPIDATALLVTSTGDVLLTCPEEPEPIILATNKGGVSPTAWPGVVQAYELNYVAGETPLTYINIVTREVVEFVPTFDQLTVISNTDARSPWQVHETGADTAGDLTLLNLQTLDTALMSSFFTAGAYPANLAPMSSSNGSEVLVVGLGIMDPQHGLTELHQDPSGPGTVLVVNETLSNTHWISVPQDLTDIVEMVLSPDGQFLALRSTVISTGSPTPQTIYSVIRTDTGEEVGRSRDAVGSQRCRAGLHR